MLKIKNRNTWKRCGICSKTTIKTPERRQWRCCQVFIVNFKHFTPLPIVFIVDFEQLNVICGKVHCVKDYLFQINILIVDTILILDYRLRFCEKLTSTSKGVFRTPGNICKLKCFAIIFNGFSFLIFIAKLFILDLCCSPSYASSIPGQFNWKFKNIKRSDYVIQKCLTCLKYVKLWPNNFCRYREKKLRNHSQTLIVSNFWFTETFLKIWLQYITVLNYFLLMFVTHWLVGNMLWLVQLIPTLRLTPLKLMLNFSALWKYEKGRLEIGSRYQNDITNFTKFNGFSLQSAGNKTKKRISKRT